MKLRLTLVTLLAALLTVPHVVTRAWQDRGQAARPGPQWPGTARRYALLVGVNNYDDPQITPLIGASNDARALEEALAQYGGFDRDRIVRLSSDQPDAAKKPTRGNILRALSNLLKAVPSDGLLVLAFSCHGVERDGRAFLLPSDAQVNYDISLLENTSLEVATIKKMIRDKQDPKTKVTGVAQVVALLDACRNDPTSGKDLSVNPLSAAYNFNLRNAGVRAFATLYATSLGDRAYENRSTKLGYFIGEVVAGLKGAAANKRGEVTLEGLLRHLEDKVPTKVTLDLGRDQKPYAVIEGYRAADLVLSVHPVAPAPAPAPAPVVTNTPPVRMSAAGVPLGPLAPFTTVTLDANGKINDRRPNQESWGYVEDLGNGVKLEMVEIPAGEFLMGEDAAGAADYEKECARYRSKDDCARWAKWQTPQRRVKVNGFLMGKYEVTQKQWVAVMGGLPPNMARLGSEFKGDDLPVVNVSWEEAQEFIGKLNEKLKLGRSVYRLPSEAEWEYAARAGTRTPYAFGETISADTANYWWDNPHRNAPKKEHLGHPVKAGSYPANAFGLFDMHGNVREWCEDDRHDSYTGAPVDGRAWVDSPGRGSGRVIRGGGWGHNAVYCRSAYRSGDAPGYHYNGLGFRLVSTNTPPVRMSAAGAPLAPAPSALTPIITLPSGVPISALRSALITTATVDANGRVTRQQAGTIQFYQEDLGGGVKLEMVAVPGGRFQMGSPSGELWRGDDETQHWVRVSDFWIGRYEVTQEQWKAVMGDLPPDMAGLRTELKGDDLPVVMVSWELLQEFIRKLNARLSDANYRLPREAEWEFAVRGGKSTPFGFGATITPEIANYNGDYPYGNAANGKYQGHPVPVGSLGVANAFGLFDMHGNVWEWCEDWYGTYPNSEVTDPTGPSSGYAPVFRGGGWNSFAVDCRSAIRYKNTPVYRNYSLGFRLLRTYR